MWGCIAEFKDKVRMEWDFNHLQVVKRIAKLVDNNKNNQTTRLLPSL